MDAIDHLTDAIEDAGGAPELIAHIDKMNVAIFAGVSDLNMDSLSSANFDTITEVIEDEGGAPEVIAHLEKIKELLINA